MPNDLFTYVHKNGSEADWAKIQKYIPPNGEIIIYNADENHPYDRIKRGDGVHLPRDLPFIGNSGGTTDIAKKVEHKLTFGAGEVYQYDGSADVTVPVYTGNYT